MANVNLVYQGTFQDDKGTKVSVPFYIVWADTATLATVGADLSALMAKVEAITDAQLIKMSFTVAEQGLPGSIKTSPVANCDNEETALFTFDLTTPVGKAFSVDIPAVAPAVLNADQKTINLSDSDVAALVTALEASAYNNLWSSTVEEVRTARKTFRKHRRQAKST